MNRNSNQGQHFIFWKIFIIGSFYFNFHLVYYHTVFPKNQFSSSPPPAAG